MGLLHEERLLEGSFGYHGLLNLLSRHKASAGQVLTHHFEGMALLGKSWVSFCMFFFAFLMRISKMFT